jgi:hypothetical protein
MWSWAHVFVAVCITVLTAPSPWEEASAQTQQNTGVQNRAESAVDACNAFKNAFRPAPEGNAGTAPDRAQRGLKGVANSGQLGIACGQALARHFESLRSRGAKGTWSEIEKEIDQVIDTYRNLVETIEGTGGVYEEGKRAVSVLDEQIKDMVAKRGESHQNVIDARKTQAAIAAGLEITKKFKAELDKALVDIQAKKSEIVEAEGIRRYLAAQQALESFNEGLRKVIDALVQAVNAPAM